MTTFKKSFLILMLPLMAFTAAHKFYLSVTHVGYSEKDDALQITTRLFIDDMEKLLDERYGLKAQLGTDVESKSADEYLEKYFRTKLLFEIDGQPAEYQFLGKKYDTDMLICYFEIPKIGMDKIKSIQIQNEILTDLFDEQQNVVHFKIKEKKKSFVLIKSDTKGMLNL
ncbi:DUF6702 family protein [Maribacter algicola]|uniref:DUF6702 family protein n=1 Tax=Meishania litoralis TaxID=3434685 RepID=A0ACC7LN59_9FLAO